MISLKIPVKLCCKKSESIKQKFKANIILTWDFSNLILSVKIVLKCATEILTHRYLVRLYIL